MSLPSSGGRARIGQTWITSAVVNGLAPCAQPVVVTVGNVSSPPVNLNVTQ